MFAPRHIIRLTDALYGDPVSFSIENLRDSLSSGQLKSKLWVLETLPQFLSTGPIHIHHLGCWHGLLSAWISELQPNRITTLVDPDSTALELAGRVHNSLAHTMVQLSAVDYLKECTWSTTATNVVINTSCEHMAADWIQYIPKGTLVIAQSTNFVTGEGHINIVNNLDQLVIQLQPISIKFAGTYSFPMYDRYMVIGTVQ